MEYTLHDLMLVVKYKGMIYWMSYPIWLWWLSFEEPHTQLDIVLKLVWLETKPEDRDMQYESG